MNILRLVGGIFTIVGAGMLVLTSVLYLRSEAFAATAQRAEGEVVELIPTRSSSSSGTSGSSLTYASRVRFTTADGRRVDFVDSVSSRPPRHDVGQRLAILYDPDAPMDATIDDFMGRWFAVLIVVGLGAVFAPLGLALFTAGVRADRRVMRPPR